MIDTVAGCLATATSTSAFDYICWCVWSTESDRPMSLTDGDPSTLLWSCSFEPSEDTFCGMAQEKTRDQFDWTVHSGATKSGDTGPQSAYHGYFYAYIEASDPRRPDDEAW